MSKFKFIATHGVHLADLDVAFKRIADHVDEGGKSHARYGFETDDAKVAAAVARVDGYGIQKAGSDDE